LLHQIALLFGNDPALFEDAVLHRQQDRLMDLTVDEAALPESQVLVPGIRAGVPIAVAPHRDAVEGAILRDDADVGGVPAAVEEAFREDRVREAPFRRPARVVQVAALAEAALL